MILTRHLGVRDTQLDDALLEQQRAAYAVQGVDEAEPAQPTKKRKKQVYVNGEDVSQFFPRVCTSGYQEAMLTAISSRKPVGVLQTRSPNPPQNRANARIPLFM